MNESQLSLMYHNLRELSVTDDVRQKEAIRGLVSHLATDKGDYDGLLTFLDYFGETLLSPGVINFIQSLKERRGLKFSRVVELGAGYGWLGRALSNHYKIPVISIDKRQHIGVDIVADIESLNGRERVIGELKEGDIIVMSELIHCLDDAVETLAPFTGYPVLIVEYNSTRRGFQGSYEKQISKFNCKPVDSRTGVTRILHRAITRNYSFIKATLPLGRQFFIECTRVSCYGVYCYFAGQHGKTGE